MSPMPPRGMAGAFGFGFSATMASVVTSSPATEPAFSNSDRNAEYQLAASSVAAPELTSAGGRVDAGIAARFEKPVENSRPVRPGAVSLTASSQNGTGPPPLEHCATCLVLQGSQSAGLPGTHRTG